MLVAGDGGRGRAALHSAPVVTVVQCQPEVTAALRRWTFHTSPFLTLLIDLSESEEDLWSGLNALARRRRIRQGGEA